MSATVTEFSVPLSRREYRDIHQITRTRMYSCPMRDDDLMMLIRSLMSSEKATGELKIFIARGSANTVVFEERTQVQP